MKKNFSNITFLFFCTILIVSCTDRLYLKKITGYLNSSTVETKAKYTSDSYRSYFLKKEGEGKDKMASLESFKNWDAPLNPDIKILSNSSKSGTWFVWFNEQNDFLKLIGYPG